MSHVSHNFERRKITFPPLLITCLYFMHFFLPPHLALPQSYPLKKLHSVTEPSIVPAQRGSVPNPLFPRYKSELYGVSIHEGVFREWVQIGELRVLALAALCPDTTTVKTASALAASRSRAAPFNNGSHRLLH